MLAMSSAFYVVLGHTVAALLLGWWYFRRYRVTRPPIGVLNLRDVILMLGAIVVVPYLYLMLPAWLVVCLLGLGIMSVLYVTVEPLLPARTWAVWLVVLGLMGTNVATALHFGVPSSWFFAVNNAILVIAIVGATNLWAQSGMRARDAAVLAGALAVYDLIATAFLPLMYELVARLAGLPFAPLVAWPMAGDGQWLGAGLGDLLVATVFPLVLRKAFGRTAGWVALAVCCATMALMLLVLDLGIVHVGIPAMVVLAPLLVVQYLYWARRHRGLERTTAEYLRADPTTGRRAVLPHQRAATQSATSG
jgi:hypothetical protein